MSRITKWQLIGGCVLLLGAGCSRESRLGPVAESELPSAVRVTVNPSGPVVIATSEAEFDLLPSGYLQAFLLKDGTRQTLDDPGTGVAGTGDYLVSGGKEVSNFALDFAHAKVSDAHGKMGSRGKRVDITAVTAGKGGMAVDKTFSVEVYDDFPTLAAATVGYRNSGTTDIQLDRAVTQHHRFNASLADPKSLPYRMWSFQGSSYDWGKDDVLEISEGFHQPNLMGAMNPNGIGGGIPVVAFWTATLGEAIGHLETLPLVASLPVNVDKDYRVNAALTLEAATLKPGETFSTPLSFVAVYSGDFYEPLRLYSRVLQREGWTLPPPNQEDYNISWCGWGYESEVTPAQMLGTLPKLKEFNIKWATLDDRWFDTYGDWEPRPDTFPDDAIKKMVDDFHRQGILVQIWWLPLGAEDGQRGYEGHRYSVAKVVQEHPDWLILDKHGQHAHMIRSLAALCPALPEVQQYYKQLTEKFIRDWGFDGHKLDNIYTMPACYNPKHHHRSPTDSLNAMADVYKVIFETTRALKPESVTQCCPCGTTPSLAWLPYMDQAVTADPVGAVQVRRRIKMYKALLGPEAAVYGDHVELSAMPKEHGEYREVGRDFASTIGPGGVVGTKFTWPDYGPKFQNVFLDPAKEAWWKKWTDIYNSKMLSKGTFLDLYVYGYDTPEGYAIRKDGRMYYAFFAPDSSQPWKGEVELRGLAPGKYHVLDYERGTDLGAVDAQNPRLATSFEQHLLLEVGRL